VKSRFPTSICREAIQLPFPALELDVGLDLDLDVDRDASEIFQLPVDYSALLFMNNPG